jgi:hypothetical protein
MVFLLLSCDLLASHSTPVISSFAADPDVVGVGGTVTLSWSVVGADSVWLMPGSMDVTGLSSLVVEPLVTTTFVLVARNGARSTSREVEVVVWGATMVPVISSFVADPGVVGVGGSVTLSWSVLGADSLRLFPGDVDVSGLSSWVAEPLVTTTFVLMAENGVGSSSRSAEVLVADLPVIESFEAQEGVVNPGLPVTLTWVVSGADGLELRGPGLGTGISVTGTSEREVVAATPGATFTLVATSALGEVDSTATVARAVNAVSVLVAGQSNAEGYNISPVAARAYIAAAEGVMMLGNDYVWKPATEPLDDCTNQVDLVSADPAGGCSRLEEGVAGVSAGVSLGNGTAAATGGTVFLIPAANGGTQVEAWLPAPDRYDRSTLFGSAAHRARLAGIEQGAPLGHEFGGDAFGAVYWFQGESNTGTSARIAAFMAETPIVLDAFQEELNAPIILAQLARRGENAVARNLNYQKVREAQRTMETGARTATGAAAPQARDRTYLVVTHDLPLWDGTHLTEEGQKELGRRVSLVIRQHLFGEGIDGSGPRLERIEQVSPTVVRVHADRPVSAPASNGADAYSGYFTVIAAGAHVPVVSIVRDADAKVVRITLGASVDGTAEVRYMPPPVTNTSIVADVIRSAACTEPMPVTGLCLPMPAFGAAVDAQGMSLLSTFVDDDDEEE